jgi:excinuclease ABC subunit C
VVPVVGVPLDLSTAGLALAGSAASPATLESLRAHVRANAARRPGVYEFLDGSGAVFYVGKAKSLRQRLLSYFTAPWPDAKGARLIRSAAAIRWRYVPSEFAALLEELRLIKRLRPYQNVHGNRTARRVVFIKVTGGPAPKLRLTTKTADPAARYYGPFRGRGRAAAALRVLDDMLGLRDCAQDRPTILGDQADFFDAPLAAGCIRYELGTCLGPCAARVTAERYGAAVREAVDFLEGRSATPLAKVLDVMADAAERAEFERAAAWREKFEAVEWLFGAVARLAAALDALSFVYLVRDATGGKDDRLYLIRRGLVLAEAPLPRTPIEQAAFAATVSRHAELPTPALVAHSAAEMDQLTLVTSWFRQHPEAFEATSPYPTWIDPA